MLVRLSVSTCGYKSGKLKMAGKAGLFPALADMAEVNVRIPAKPALPKSKSTKKASGLTTCTPNIKLNTKKAKRPIPKRYRKLYTVLPNTNTCGFTKP